MPQPPGFLFRFPGSAGSFGTASRGGRDCAPNLQRRLRGAVLCPEEFVTDSVFLQGRFQPVQVTFQCLELLADVVALAGQRIEPFLHFHSAAQRGPCGVVVVVRNRSLRFTVACIQICSCLAGKRIDAMADGGEVCNAAAGAVEVFFLLPLRFAERGDGISWFHGVAARGDDA